MKNPEITVYGAYWCPDCYRSKQFLGAHQIPYYWVDIEADPTGEQFVIDANHGKRRIPTVRFADGSILSAPSNADLAAKLGLKTTAERHHYDLIIVGAGPAGLTAALYTAREGIDTLIIERAAVPGEDDYLGAGVHFCATCDGPFYKGQPVAVVGGGNSAAEEALFLSRIASHVTLLVRGDHLTAIQVIREKVSSHPTIDVRFNTAVEGFEGAASKLQTVRTRRRDTDTAQALPVPGVFIFIGLDPNTGFLEGSPIRLDRHGFVVTGHALVHDGDRPAGFEQRDPATLETSVSGIFAIGDVRAGSTKQVASAAGEGAAVALMIRDYLKRV